MTARWVLLALASLLALPALAGPVGVRDRQFVGPEGEPIILRGLNVAQSAKRKPYLPWQGPDEFALMKSWGCNCVRLLIIWAGIEPEPGSYHEEYLAAVRERLDWAQQAGLHVILDMHQDVYGEKYNHDGAPAWATVDGDLPYEPDRSLGWAAGYFQPAVMMAFENFWNDAPAPDGTGLQEHFVGAWRHAAEKLSDHPAVIGYDLLNEPFYGNLLGYPEALAILGKLVEVLPEGMNPMTFFTPVRGNEAQELLADPERFFPALDLADGLFRRFEEEKLAPFYRRIIEALVEVTPQAIFFLEPHIGASSGTHSFLTRPDMRGQEINIAYAPHFYDPGCSPKVPYDGNSARARIAFERMSEVGERLNAPVLLGEWGDAESPRETAPQYLADQGQLLRELGFSHCYWQYGRDLTERPGFPALLEVLAGGG